MRTSWNVSWRYWIVQGNRATHIILSILVLLPLSVTKASAQRALDFEQPMMYDTLPQRSKTIDVTPITANDTTSAMTKQDSLTLASAIKATKKHKRDYTTWTPDPKKAMWLALVIPGAGQIYNRKYWKLPIVYGGIIGCAYAMSWNNQMYLDYSQAYNDITDSDPNTKSYESFAHLGVTIDDSNKDRYTSLFKSRRDQYRRWRDLSTFVMIGVYVLSVIDAYVDAQLSKFDISDDISLRVGPSVIGTGEKTINTRSTGVGVSGALTF